MLDLGHLLEYKNANVLNRYTVDFPGNQLGAEEAFENLMKFFWLNRKHAADKLRFVRKEDLNFTCGIHAEMKEIDDMWHTFLLFTRDYHFFCKKYLGDFFHHVPNTDKSHSTKEAFAIEFARYLSYVYDNLGEECLVKWFGQLL